MSQRPHLQHCEWIWVVVVPSAPARADTTRKLVARLHTLEAAVARLTAAVPVTVVEPARVAMDDVLVENWNSLVLHRLRPGVQITISGWNIRRAAAGNIPLVTYAYGVVLNERPWKLICERCCSTERELARLAPTDPAESESE